MNINDQGTFYVEGEYKAGETILTAGDWELVADVDGYKKYAIGYEPDDFPELVTNGTFDTDTSGWTEVRGTLSVDAGRLKLDYAQQYGVGTQFVSGLEIGKTYRISGELPNHVETQAIYLRFDNPLVSLNQVKLSTGGVVDYYWTCNNPNPYLCLLTGDQTTALFDNISVKEVAPESPITLGNGHHKDFRYYPYKLSTAEITELTR